MRFVIKGEVDEGVYIFLTNDEEDRIFRECELLDLSLSDEEELKYFFESITDFLPPDD